MCYLPIHPSLCIRACISVLNVIEHFELLKDGRWRDNWFRQGNYNIIVEPTNCVMRMCSLVLHTCVWVAWTREYKIFWFIRRLHAIDYKIFMVYKYTSVIHCLSVCVCARGIYISHKFIRIRACWYVPQLRVFHFPIRIQFQFHGLQLSLRNHLVIFSVDQVILKPSIVRS